MKTWLLIALLLEKPSQLPGDQRSMKFAVMATIATNILATLVLVDSRFLIAEALLDVVLAAVCLFVGLALISKPERFIQAFSAYCGVGVVLNLASMVLLGPFHIRESPDLVNGIGRFLEYLFLVWSIAAVAHIVRYSFEISSPLSITVAVLYVLVYIMLAGAIFAI